MKIVMFGDSITFGYGVAENDNIVSLISNKLACTVINSGLNGDTTRWALTRIKKDVLDEHPDIVTILFGSNDSAPFEDVYITPFEFEQNIIKMIQLIKENFSDTKIVLITPPPVDESGFMPYTTNQRLSKYVDIICSISAEKNTLLADLNTYFMSKTHGNLESYLQEDGCHFSSKGYELFCECLYDVLRYII